MTARWAITPLAISGDAPAARRAADLARAKAAEARKRAENVPPPNVDGEAWVLHQVAVWVGNFFTALADLCSAQADLEQYPRDHSDKFAQQRAEAKGRIDAATATLKGLIETIASKPWVALALREIMGAGAAVITSQGWHARALAELQTVGVMGPADFDTPECANERQRRLAIGEPIKPPPLRQRRRSSPSCITVCPAVSSIAGHSGQDAERRQAITSLWGE